LDQVNAISSADIAMAVPKGSKEKYSGRATLLKEVVAPVKKGQKVGEFMVTEKEKQVMTVPLLAQNEIKRASILRQMYKVLDQTLTR
ncbi:MAG: D-alanyl-D-alanine carboxypeptidase, partial [Desulfotomaculaceae bacterium]